LKHSEFSRIAEEEASRASQADGVDYFVRAAAADGGVRTSITIHVLHPKSGESLVLLSTAKDPADQPVLDSLTEKAARRLVQELLSTARANRAAELYLDDFLHSLRGTRGGPAD
jgi:hypothetical protein